MVKLAINTAVYVSSMVSVLCISGPSVNGRQHCDIHDDTEINQVLSSCLCTCYRVYYHHTYLYTGGTAAVTPTLLASNPCLPHPLHRAPPSEAGNRYSNERYLIVQTSQNSTCICYGYNELEMPEQQFIIYLR